MSQPQGARFPQARFYSPHASKAMRISRFSAVSADLFLISASRQITHPYCRPAKIGHNLCQASKGARRPLTLWHLKQVQQGLRADALQLIKEVNFATHAG
jgi:hypothetical protein